MAGGSAAKGPAGTKSIIELVKEATGASEEDIKQSLQEHGGDVNATVNALLDDGQFSSVINKKTKKKQKEDERRSIQQREASAAAAGKVLEVPRRQSAGGQRDRAGRMRDPTRSGRGRGSQARTQPPANDVSDAGGAQEFAPNTESDTSYTLPPALVNLQQPPMPQQQQQKQQQQVQLERPTVGIGSGKPWGAPTEGSMSIAERLRQPQQLHHQQPQQVKPQEQVEGPGPNTAAPTTPPADNQQSLSNGVELPHDQQQLPLQQSDASQQPSSQPQQQGSVPPAHQLSQQSLPPHIQQQPQNLSQQLQPPQQQQQQQRRPSLDHAVTARAQGSMDNRDAIAPGQSRPVNIDAPDDPQISWGGMTNVTQASVHPALGQGMGSGRAGSSDGQVGSRVGSSLPPAVHSNGPSLSDPAIVSHSMASSAHLNNPSQGDSSERMQLQFGQFNLSGSSDLTSSLPSKQPQQQAASSFVPPSFSTDLTHTMQGVDGPRRDLSQSGSRAAPAPSSEVSAHRYGGPPAPAATMKSGHQERPPVSSTSQPSSSQQRPLQYPDDSCAAPQQQQQPQQLHSHSVPLQRPPQWSFSHSQQQQQQLPPSQGQQQRPLQPPPRQQQHQYAHQQSYAGTSAYNSGYNQHYSQQFGGVFAQPTHGYEGFGDHAGFSGRSSLDRHVPSSSGYAHGNASSHTAPAVKSADSQPPSYAPSAEKGPMEDNVSLLAAPSAASGSGTDAVTATHGHPLPHGLQGYGNNPTPGTGGYGYNSSSPTPAAYSGSGYGTSSYGGGSGGGGGGAYGSMSHPGTGQSYGSGNHHASGYSQHYPGYQGQGGGYGSKDGHDRDNSVYQHESNPYAGANASYELQGYGSQGGVPYQQGRQSHWQGQGGGSSGFGNSAYSPYNNYPQQGGNK